MSHFSVIVFSKTKDISHIEAMLQPYHAYACTGINDEYVQDIDVTSEFIERFLNEQSETAIHPDGRQLNVYDDFFCRELTDEETAAIGPFCSSVFVNGKRIVSKDWNDGKGYRPKIHDIPSSPWELKIKYVKDYMSPYAFLMDDDDYPVCHHNEKLDIYGDHKWGYALVDENLNVIKVVERKNPNYKWDWWEVGGRWAGFFTGFDGLKYNQIKRSDCDLESMLNILAAKAEHEYDMYEKIADGRTAETWDTVQSKFEDIQKCREFYHKQQLLVDIRKCDELFWSNIDQFILNTREEYVQSKRKLPAYAILDEDGWSAKGQMGFFGCSDDAVEESAWWSHCTQMITDLDGDMYMTIVDCHI